MIYGETEQSSLKILFIQNIKADCGRNEQKWKKQKMEIAKAPETCEIIIEK